MIDFDVTNEIEQFANYMGKSVEEASSFIRFVWNYLDSCGYFMGDYNIHNLPWPEDKIPYYKQGIGQWLLDMALQYNMEHGKQYECKLISE